MTAPTAAKIVASRRQSSLRLLSSTPANNIVLRTLSLFLGLLFIFYGLLKVSTVVSAEMHRELRRSFAKFSKNLPLTQLLGFKIPSKYLRLTVGYSEMVGGAVLALAPWERVKMAANIFLLATSLMVTYCNCLVDEAFDRQTPAIVFTMMLTCRLVVHYQVLKRNTEREVSKKKAENESDPQRSFPLLKEKALYDVLRRNGICPQEFLNRIRKLGFTDVIDYLAQELKEQNQRKKKELSQSNGIL